MSNKGRAYRALAMSTLAFTVCFAVWVINGVLATFLVDNRVYQWDKAQIGWLIGIPILTGAVLRLPMGMLTDRYGGRVMFPALMLATALPTYLLSYADTYWGFLVAGLGFGVSGASFAVGVAYIALWFRPEQQGTVLGVFGIGNAGAALTSIGAPFILRMLTDGGANLEGWRALPKLYAAMLVVTAVLFWLSTSTRKVEGAKKLSLRERLAPLRRLQVWRFGLYYFFLFGGFVALSQWLIPYYVNVYDMTLASAGLMAAMFSLPAGVIRAIGGWASDKWGARAVLYGAFGTGIILMLFLFPPRMEIQSRGEGVIAERGGTVTAVSPLEIAVGQDRYAVSQQKSEENGQVKIRLGIGNDEEGVLIFPAALSWQEPLVKIGDSIEKGQLLARGVTRVYFQANMWIFSGFVILAGISMGIGSAAVYKHITSYFPASVGAVGGAVGALGALGGFLDPIIFGYLLKATGIWTTCWVLLALVGLSCLVWMHLVIGRMMRTRAPVLMRQIEDTPSARMD